MEGPKLALAHLLFTDAHKQLGLHSHGIFPHPVAPGNLQGVNVVGAVGRELQHSPVEGLGRFPVLPFRVDDDNIVPGSQGDEGDKLLHGKGLTGAGDAQNESVRVQEVFTVADQQIF